MSDDAFVRVMVFVFAVLLCGGGLAADCYGPCEWYRGSSLSRAPARCIPELAK